MNDVDLTYDGRPPVILEGAAGDVSLFVSDAWHRGLPARRRDTVATSSRCTTPGATSRNASAPPTSRTSCSPKRSRGPTPIAPARSSACTTRSSTTPDGRGGPNRFGRAGCIRRRARGRAEQRTRPSTTKAISPIGSLPISGPWDCWHALAGPSERDDVVQEALTRAWRKRTQFDSDRGSPRSWLLAIVADRARRTWRRKEPRPAAFAAGFVAGPDATRLDLEAAVAWLPSRMRLAVECVYFVDLTIADTAVVMGVSEGTVKLDALGRGRVCDRCWRCRDVGSRRRAARRRCALACRTA